MSASAVRGGQVYVEIGANPNKFLAALRAINARIGDMGDTLRSAGIGMSAIGAAISGPIMAVGGAFVEQTGEIQAMRRALADIGKAVGEAVAPAFVGMANVIAGAARAVSQFIRANQPLIRTALAIGGYFLAWGMATTALGVAMSSFSRIVAGSIGPITAFAGAVASSVSAFAAFAASGPVLAAVGTLAALAAGMAAAGVNVRGLGRAIGGAFANPIRDAMSLFNDLAGTASLTIEGIYRAISAGDLRGAVDVLFAGWQASWARGTQALLNATDPVAEEVQNVFSDLGVSLAAWWDQTWTDIATSNWGGYLLGALDNLANGAMATWDTLIGNLQKAWARYSAWWSGDTEKMRKEFERIDQENANRAAERDRIRPGFAGRTGLTDEQKAQMQQETRDRQAAMAAEAQRLRQERSDRTAQNVRDRAAAVDQANANLRAQVDRFPVPPPVVVPQEMRTETAGTFSAFGLGQLGTGSIDKQQLDELKRIREELQRAAMAGGIGP